LSDFPLSVADFIVTATLPELATLTVEEPPELRYEARFEK
jgi:hypothetical protein